MNGTPIPYSMSSDNLILLLFVTSLLGCAYIFMHNGRSIAERIKSMYYYSGQITPYNNRTEITLVGNILLYAQSILHSAIIVMGYLQNNGNLLCGFNSNIIFATLILIFTLILPAKYLIYGAINLILFGKHETEEWKNSYFFTIQITSFLLLPLAAASILLPRTPAVIYWIYMALVCIIYFAMLSFRCFNIIFTESKFFLDIFLYLCAIEFLPMAIIWQIITQTNLLLIIKI